MATIQGLPEDNFGRRQAGVPQVTLLLDSCEAEAVMMALVGVGWSEKDAEQHNGTGFNALPSTSLKASGARVQAALSWWQKAGY